jgi:hypothetical protein
MRPDGLGIVNSVLAVLGINPDTEVRRATASVGLGAPMPAADEVLPTSASGIKLLTPAHFWYSL